MNPLVQKIDLLKKIKLLIEAGTHSGTMDLSGGQQTFEFIFGIGTQGLPPFEYHLADKAEQEEIELILRPDEIHETFQHLLPLPITIPDQIESLHFKIKIVGITTADPKEVVKAMAEIAACGDQCCGH